MYPLKTEVIADGVSLHLLQEPQFKTNQISVYFFCKMSREDASANALVPSLLKRGCASYPSMTEINKRLEELYGAALSEGVRKLGEYQVMSLTLTILDDSFALNKEPLLQEGIKLLQDVIFHPILEGGLFRKQDFELEKQNLVDLIESEINDKRIYAIDRMNEILYGDSPAGFPLFGTVERARELTGEMAIKAYKRLISSANIHIFCTGHEQMEKASQIFRKAFEGLERKDVISLQTASYSSEMPVKEQAQHLPVLQSKLVMGFRAKEGSDDLHARRLMTALFGGTPTSKLFLHVRERLSLCYYCAARYDKIKNVIMVDSGVKEENIEKAKDEILNQLKGIANGDFTEEEFSFALRSLTNALNSLYDFPSGLESWYLTQILMKTQNTPQEDLTELLKVKMEDVKKAADCTELDTVYVLAGKEE